MRVRKHRYYLLVVLTNLEGASFQVEMDNLTKKELCQAVDRAGQAIFATGEFQKVATHHNFMLSILVKDRTLVGVAQNVLTDTVSAVSQQLIVQAYPEFVAKITAMIRALPDN